jgi:F-actin capping protein, beta subunit
MTSLTPPLIVVGMDETRGFFIPYIQTTRLVHCCCDCNPKRRYFEGGVSSVFLWDLEDGGFAGVVLLKKST